MSERVKLRVADGAKDQPASEQSQPAKPQAGKPSRIFPTVRISFSKQPDILRAYAAGSSNGKVAATLKDVAEIVQMAPQTVSLANPFFTDVKLLQRTSEGAGLTPAPEVLEYQHAYEWDKETAAHKLAPVFSKTWFWEALQNRLAFDKLTEDQAVTILAEKSTAGPAYKSQLRMILDFLELAGMVRRENGQVFLMKQSAQAALTSVPAAKGTPESESPEPTRPIGATRASASTTNFVQKAGAISFDVSVHIDVTELIGWSPERISALFAGVAQVVSAKGMVEKKAVQD